MITLPLPLYQCQHTETVRIRAYRHRKDFYVARCTLLATHRLGLGRTAVRLCTKHTEELKGHRFVMVDEVRRPGQ